jgi:hypothetical protein
MSHVLGLAIESLVAVLLLFTIGYCMTLNTRLKRLRSDEQSLRATISELITATEIAERAIGGLKITVRECDENLGRQLKSGADLAERMAREVKNGEDILSRLVMIAQAARPAHASDEMSESMPRGSAASKAGAGNAKALLAAAQAFSDRKRNHGIAA